MGSEQIYHEFDYEGKHYKLVHDHQHETVGSYSYDTEEETKAAEDEELAKLSSGEWVVLGCIVTTKCKGLPIRERRRRGETQGRLKRVHCNGCSGIGSEDSCWGIVVENDIAKVEALAKEMF